MLTWLEPYWLSAVSIAATALGLGFLLLIHEFGHFFVAKRAGVKVEVFSMGICHFLLTWTWKGTVYALSWLPLGGYVRMAGQQDLAAPTGQKPLPHEYGAKPVWVRMLIIVAGVTMNFIGGVACFALAFLWGREVVSPVVDGLRLDLPCYQRAHEAGLREGDRVLAVNGDPVYSFQGLNMRVLRVKPGSEVTFRVRHDERNVPEGHQLEEDLVLRTFEGEARGLSASAVTLDEPRKTVPLRLGFVGEDRLVITPLPKVLAEFPEWAKVFKPGDSILTANGQSCRSREDFARIAEQGGGAPVKLEVLGLDGQPRTLELPVRGGYKVGIVFIKEKKSIFAFFSRKIRPLRVVGIEKGSAAAKAGLDLGDEIYLDRNLKPCTHEDFVRAVREAEGRPLKVVVRSGSDGAVREDVELQATKRWEPSLGGDESGVPWGNNWVVTEVARGSSAEAKGLRPGAAMAWISTRVDRRTPGAVDRDAPATLEWMDQGRKYGPHRVMPFPAGPAINWKIPRQEWLQMDLGRSAAAGWGETRETLLSTTVVLRKLTSGKIGVDVVSGPVGIVHIAYRMAQEGLGPLLWLLGMMGVSLAFFNLLPIPILDGGHLAFLAWEGVFRKPPSPRVVGAVQYAGLILIVGLFVLVFWNDISRILRMG